MRQVRICRNGQRIYSDTFQAAERARHEEWTTNFLSAMKLRDFRQYLEQTKSTQNIGASTTQAMLWNTILLLRGAGLMTNREAANICLVHFTWTQEQAEARLQELQERYNSARNN